MTINSKTKLLIRLISALSFLACLLAGSSPPGIAQPPPPDPRFGAVEALSDPAAAAEAGVGWERIVFHWSEVQPSGPDDWNPYHVPDEWLAQAASAGREVVGLIKHTPAWAARDQPGCGPPSGLELPVDDPGNLWANFVRRIVQLYDGRIATWIIWNEPDISPDGPIGAEWCGTVEEYYRLLQVAFLAAHQVKPDVTIHMAALTYYHDPGYLRRFLDVAIQDPTGPDQGYYFDVVPIHVYFQSEAVPFVIEQTRSTLEAYGIQKPIWVNETNASPDSDPLWPIVRPQWRVDLTEQASFLLQSFALALASGAERVAVYKWVDAGLQPGGEPFGLIRPDFSRRPAYDAYRLITTHYAGTLTARAISQDLFYQVTLDRGSQTTRVLWTRTSSSITLSVPALAAEGLLVQQTGETLPIQASNGLYTIPLPGGRCGGDLGCIIGGPTVLLVEPGTGDPGDPWLASQQPPTQPPGETPQEPTDEQPTPVSPTLPPPPTPIPTASPTPTPTSTPTPTPTPTPIPTSTPTPSPTPTPAPAMDPPSASVSGGLLLAVLIGLTLMGGALLATRVRARG